MGRARPGRVPSWFRGFELEGEAGGRGEDDGLAGRGTRGGGGERGSVPVLFQDSWLEREELPGQ